MLVHSLASKYAKFVVLVRQMYLTPPFRPLDPPLLKSDDLFFREPRDIGPPLSKILDTPLCDITKHGIYMIGHILAIFKDRDFWFGSKNSIKLCAEQFNIFEVIKCISGHVTRD